MKVEDEVLEPSTEEDAPELLLGPMLRYQDEKSATIWVEVSRRCIVEVLGCAAPTFTIFGRHFSLVVIDPLPSDGVEYDVRLDGHQVWPAEHSNLPPSSIRPAREGGSTTILVGSCRAAAPHEPPYTLELALDHEGRGLDAMWAHAKRMADQPTTQWPDLLLLVGDQIYADDSSPRAKERIEARRGPDADLPPEIVANFDEYRMLYHEAWSQPRERWLLSTVPSAMIFDDHDMVDDWNISRSWAEDIEQESWWERHAIEGLMSYWIYQHLGNLSPTRIEEEGLLASLVDADDGTDVLRQWAIEAQESSTSEGGYRFSFVRRFADVTAIVIDCRMARVLDGPSRRMVGPHEWQWVRAEAERAGGHLILATSLPVFIADGLHDLQVWNERMCAGAWGAPGQRLGEKIRRSLDLEDWSAFADSYAEFVELVDQLRRARRVDSIVIASGDIHFSYAARVPNSYEPETERDIDVWQVVSSPIRNALIPPERGVMRSALTDWGRRLGAVLRRSVRAPDTRPDIEMVAGPFFANNMCELRYADSTVDLVVEQAAGGDEHDRDLSVVAQIQLYGAAS